MNLNNETIRNPLQLQILLHKKKVNFNVVELQCSKKKPVPMSHLLSEPSPCQSRVSAGRICLRIQFLCTITISFPGTVQKTISFLGTVFSLKPYSFQRMCFFANYILFRNSVCKKNPFQELSSQKLSFSGTVFLGLFLTLPVSRLVNF